MRKFTTKVFLLLAIFCLLPSIFYISTPFCISPVFAQEDGLGQSQITPASPFYFLKSVREILELKFAGTTQVAAVRELEFSTRRIREVKGLVNTRQDLIESTLHQYLFHLQEFIGRANLKDPDFAIEVSKNITGQMSVLQSVYSNVSDKRAQMSIRATINSLSKWDQELIDRLNLAKEESAAKQVSVSKLSGCNFLAKEASSSALNEVERGVYLERAERCRESSIPAGMRRI
ncbi:hypothetical protein KKE78_01440 [Patescibacteria group bacterium]|nr:hypothetical protein [Patescibacteria group bacterium]